MGTSLALGSGLSPFDLAPPFPAGVRTRPGRARAAMLSLANSSKYPVAVMPDAKGMFPEDHQQ